MCHQIANRILAAAGIILPDTVDTQIRGTYGVWDEYGWNLPGQPLFDRWPNRKIICAAPPSAGQSTGSRGPSSGSASFNFPQFTIGSTGSMNLSVTGGDPPDRRSRLRSLVRAAKLGRPVDDGVIEKLATMQARLQATQRELGQMVATEQITREKYIAEFDKALKEACQIGEGLLGFDDFHKVFGEFRVHNMGDVKAFVAGGGAAAR
jgi:hypothetical protein